MGQARHDCFRLIRGQLENPSLQAPDLIQNVIYGVAQVKSDICCDLVISGATSVEFFANFANSAGQGAFNVHMDIFKTN